LLGTAILLVVLAAGFTLVAHTAGASGEDAPKPEVRIVTQFDAPAPPSSASAQVTAMIPPRTFVHLDKHGEPVEAMTNSGQRPSPTDQFFLSGDGPTRPLDPTLVPDVLRRSAAGDWSQAGRYVRLTLS
jgi:hypothetical protein